MTVYGSSWQKGEYNTCLPAKSTVILYSSIADIIVLFIFYNPWKLRLCVALNVLKIKIDDTSGIYGSGNFSRGGTTLSIFARCEIELLLPSTKNSFMPSHLCSECFQLSRLSDGVDIRHNAQWNRTFRLCRLIHVQNVFQYSRLRHGVIYLSMD
jgi:hypothetical protein